MRPRKASLHISLVLIGAASTASCGPSPEPELRRPVYASLEDCKADWDQQANACESFTTPDTASSATSTGTSSGSSTSHTSARYYGPWYWSRGGSSDWERPHPNSRAIGATSAPRSASSAARSGSSGVARSGFGSTGSSHASSSS